MLCATVGCWCWDFVGMVKCDQCTGNQDHIIMGQSLVLIRKNEVLVRLYHCTSTHTWPMLEGRGTNARIHPHMLENIAMVICGQCTIIRARNRTIEGSTVLLFLEPKDDAGDDSSCGHAALGHQKITGGSRSTKGLVGNTKTPPQGGVPASAA